MIDPKEFITNSTSRTSNFKDIEGTFTCSDIGCFEIVNTGKYDAENKKVYWTCPNGHDGEARLVYE